MIQADERKVKQVLLNLLSNALKFTREGGRIDGDGDESPVRGLAEITTVDRGAVIDQIQSNRSGVGQLLYAIDRFAMKAREISVALEQERASLAAYETSLRVLREQHAAAPVGTRERRAIETKITE